MCFFLVLIVLSVFAWIAHDVWSGRFSDVGPVDVEHSIALPESRERM